MVYMLAVSYSSSTIEILTILRALQVLKKRLLNPEDTKERLWAVKAAKNRPANPDSPW